MSEFENLIYHPERDDDDKGPGVSFGDGAMSPEEMVERQRRAVEHMKTLDGVLGLIAVFEEGDTWVISATDQEKLDALGITLAEFQEIMDWPLSKRTPQ